MDPALLAAVLAFVAIGGAGFVFSGKNVPATSQKRIKAVSSGGRGGSGGGERRNQSVEMAALKRKQSAQEALKEMAMTEKQSRKRRVSIKGQMAQAGVTWSLTRYWIIAGALGVVLAVTGLIVQGWIGAAVGAFVGALGLPRWFLGVLVSGRQKKFSNQMSDGIDVIVRGVKSGLPLNQCLRIIAAESPEPLRAEFQMLCDGQAMGVPLEQSLQRMYERTPLPEVNFFTIVLVIQQRTGGNLSESLGNLSTVLRSRKLMKEKVKALSSEAKASAMIIGALPFFVMGAVYFTKPDYITILFVHPTGHLILLGCTIMMTAGILIMNKMVNFKF